MYVESHAFDIAENILMLGHASMHNTALAGGNPIRIISDREYENTDTPGAWLNFTAKPGRALLINLFADNDRYRVFACKGEVPIGNKQQNGFTGAIFRPDIPLRRYYETAARLGMTQHSALCYGNVEEPLRLFCEIAGIEYVSCEEDQNGH